MADDAEAPKVTKDPLENRAYRNPRAYVTKAEIDGYPPGEHVLKLLDSGHVHSPIQAPVDPVAAGIHVEPEKTPDAAKAEPSKA